MRLAACIFAIAASACTINHVSDQLACTESDQCGSGRNCVNGYCVVGSGSGCPDACQTCDPNTMSCSIDGSGNGANQLSCPDGWNCTINCTGRCRQVDCSDAASCTINCSGNGSCEEIDCGNGRCTINCSGSDSCNRVDCENACACDVTCSGANSCDRADCPNNCEAGNGCTSTTPGCTEC